MSYLVHIEDSKQSKSLIQYLISLNYVKIIEQRERINMVKDKNYTEFYDLNGKQISIAEFYEIIESSENSNSIPIEEAIIKSGQWKNKRK